VFNDIIRRQKENAQYKAVPKIPDHYLSLSTIYYCRLYTGYSWKRLNKPNNFKSQKDV